MPRPFVIPSLQHKIGRKKLASHGGRNGFVALPVPRARNASDALHGFASVSCASRSMNALRRAAACSSEACHLSDGSAGTQRGTSGAWPLMDMYRLGKQRLAAFGASDYRVKELVTASVAVQQR